MLQRITGRLRDVLRPGDIIGRWAVDEFAVLLEHALRNAINTHDQLLVHYQAQQDLDGTLSGFEALMRWQHPQLGLIAPAQFLPAAEEAGLMAALDESVLRMAGGELRRWRDAGWDKLRVAVNLSNQTFQRPDLVALMTQLVGAAGAPRSALEIQLTEEIVMEKVGTAVTTMDKLCALGFSLTIDDFGTGYSSLSQIKRCPIGLLKIDRCFTTDVTRDASDQAITGAIIALSHKRGIKVLADGVETEAQLELARQSGCEAMQV